MTNQIAVIVEEKVENNQIKILRESENYFDRIVAIESKDLTFYFDEQSNDTLMYCYFLQVCPHQQNLNDLSKNINKPISEIKDEINDQELPPRILQNVNGYLEIGSQRSKTFGCENGGPFDKLPMRYFSFLVFSNGRLDSDQGS